MTEKKTRGTRHRSEKTRFHALSWANEVLASIVQTSVAPMAA